MATKRVRAIPVKTIDGWQVRLITPALVETYVQVFPSKAAAQRAARALRALLPTGD